MWDGKAPQPSAAQTPAQDTIRLDDVTKKVKQIGGTSQETVRFTPVGEEPEDAEPPVMPVKEEKVEPFSDQWEPE